MFSPEVTINGEVYKLARKDVLERYGAGYTARSWSSESKKKTTQFLSKPNVRSADIPGEYIISYDDWSAGATAETQARQGTIYNVDDNGINPFGRGVLRPVGGSSSITYDAAALTGDPTCIVDLKGVIYVAIGNKVFKIDDNTLSRILVLDDGSGNGLAGNVSDMVVWDDKLWVALGTGNIIKWYDPSLTTSGNGTDQVYADYFTIVNNELWRSLGNSVYKLVGSDPSEFNDWGSGISIGSSDTKITDLNALGDKLAVSKEDGLYIGDSAAIFPNVLPNVISIRDIDNGKGTVVAGDTIFYPYKNGLLRYSPGEAEEVGIARQLALSGASFTNDRYYMPSDKITALCASGDYLWAATNPSLTPAINPSNIFGTKDNGATYTDYTSDLTDADITTIVSNFLPSNLAGGDYLLIGSADKFTGIYFGIQNPNGEAGSLVIEYWNGSAWAALANDNPVIDDTFYPGTVGTGIGSATGVSLRKSGWVYWPDKQLPNWAVSTINGATCYWIRLSHSAGISATTAIHTLQISTHPPRVYFFRGRRRKYPDDNTDSSILWEYSFVSNMPERGMERVTALTVTPSHLYNYNHGGTLLAIGRQHALAFELEPEGVTHPNYSQTSSATLPIDDAGTPMVNKTWLSASVSCKNLSATNTFKLYHRVEGESALTLTGTATTDGVTKFTFPANTTGRTIQLHLRFTVGTGIAYQPELHKIEVRFRERPEFINKYTMLIECGDNQVAHKGGRLPDGGVQLAALEALIGTDVSIIDPLGRSITCTIDSVREMEFLQDKNNNPIMLVEVVATEV